MFDKLLCINLEVAGLHPSTICFGKQFFKDLTTKRPKTIPHGCSNFGSMGISLKNIGRPIGIQWHLIKR